MKSDSFQLSNITKKLYDFDRDQSCGEMSLVGVDEAGRGPLAGPVVAAAVRLDNNKTILGINDSKKLSAKTREALFHRITDEALGWSTGSSSHEDIDSMNILNATFRAMKMAVETLTDWDIVLVDGNMTIPMIAPERQKSIVRGDALSASIAAASIVAKVTRDRIMMQYHERFPLYCFDRHKGYGTRLHFERIKKYGLCEIHRKSFCRQMVTQTELFLT